MIFPVPQDIKPFQSHPVTWTVVLLNLLLFVMIFADQKQLGLSGDFLEDQQLQTGGRMYQQYLASLSDQDLQKYPDWIRRIKTEVVGQSEVLGVMALKDQKFLDSVEMTSYLGDPVAIAAWKKSLTQHHQNQTEQVIFKFGLSASNDSVLRWVTYQFSHSSWMHLLSNLTFIIIFSFALEGLIGGFGYLLVYLLGGFAGAFLFMAANPFGAIPMVGASASASALISFYVAATWGKNTRFFDLLSFITKRNPWVYLPTIIIIPLHLLTDFSQMLATPEGLGSSIAYSAHIGGTLMGLALGFLNKILTKSQRVPS